MIEVLRRPFEFTLAAAVGVEDDALLGCSMCEGHREGVFDQFGAHMVGQCPADHPTRGQVDDGGQLAHPSHVAM